MTATAGVAGVVATADADGAEVGAPEVVGPTAVEVAVDDEDESVEGDETDVVGDGESAEPGTPGDAFAAHEATTDAQISSAVARRTDMEPPGTDTADDSTGLRSGSAGTDLNRMYPVTPPMTESTLEGQLGLARRIVDQQSLARSVKRLAERSIQLPTFSQLADPATIPAATSLGTGGDRARRRPPVEPLPRPLAQSSRSIRPDLDDGARAHRASEGTDWHRQPSSGGVRRVVPDDHRPQGARRVLVPRARV